MATYQFGDAEAKTFELVPEGVYAAEVVSIGFEICDSEKETVRGCPMVIPKFKIKDKECSLSKNLIIAEVCLWQIDHFVKSFNVLVDGKPAKKGDNIDLGAGLVGLRGWIDVIQVKGRNGKTYNEIRGFPLDKPRLPRNPDVAIPVPEPEPKTNDVEGW